MSSNSFGNHTRDETNQTPATLSSDFVNHSYDCRLNWTPFSPVTITNYYYYYHYYYYKKGEEVGPLGEVSLYKTLLSRPHPRKVYNMQVWLMYLYIWLFQYSSQLNPGFNIIWVLFCHFLQMVLIKVEQSIKTFTFGSTCNSQNITLFFFWTKQGGITSQILHK